MTRRALIVEDDPACAEMAQIALLGIPGLEIVSAPDAEAARAHWDTGAAYVVLITDVHLPGENGLSLIAALRSTFEGSKLPVIVTTSSREASVREQAESLHVTAFLEKPYSPARLRDAVAAILHNA